MVYRKIITVLLITHFVAQIMFAGTTGKIAGTVVDKNTGQPLVGANVIVFSTSVGAATDMSGQYTILYVPPGTYEVQAWLVGYGKVVVKDVRVHIDQTARVNFELETQVIQGETITVLADRATKAVRPDVATSSVSVTNEELDELPVSNVTDIVGMQAGIKNGVQVRGGSEDAILFLIDGVSMRDPRNNKPLTKIALAAVKEISVERGGFNAEYGQVQSGIVNVVTKEGENNYFGSLQINWSPPHAKYFQIDGIPDVHDENSYWMRPFLDNEVCWTGTDNWDKYTRDQYPSFVGWNAVSEQLLSDDDPTNDLTPLGAQRVFMYETRKKQTHDLADYNIDAGFGGPVPLISDQLGGLKFFTSYRQSRDVLLWAQANPDYRDWDWTMQLISDIKENMKLTITAMTGNLTTLAENWNYDNYPHWPHEIANGTGGYAMFNMFSNWAWSVADIGYDAYSAKLTHTLTPRTFYEVSLEHLNRKYDTGPTGLRDTTRNLEVLPGYWVNEYPLGYWPYETVGVLTDIADGAQASLARDNSKTGAITFKAHLTSQVNFHNLVKTGIEVISNDLNLDYGFIKMQSQGRDWANHVNMQVEPIRIGAYIQDKLEANGFTMNAGLRVDYSDSNIDWYDLKVNMYNANFISDRYNDDIEFEMKKSKPQMQISPRLGISHPITENSKLFFNYGHFKQMPQYETLFRISRSNSGSLSQIGDPNLVLAKTVSYELGYDHLIHNTLLLQIAAFYKDISDQQNITIYESINGNSYTLTTSNGYEDIRGLELTLRKSTGDWFTGFLNYTYQASSRGFFGRTEKYEDPAEQARYDEETTNLYQTRPTPTPFARANLSFHTPDQFGPKILWHKILGGWGLNLLLSWEKGGRTTYNPKNVSGIVNNVQYVTSYGSTLRASKTISTKKFSLQFMLDVSNLFNKKYLRNTWDQNYLKSLHLPESKAYDNIVGKDKIGTYRKPGVEWQPIEYRAQIEGTTPPANDVPIYYEGNTGKYWEVVDGQWLPVSDGKRDKILDDKAYIFNAGPSTYWFLGPRNTTFGIRLSFDLN